MYYMVSYIFLLKSHFSSGVIKVKCINFSDFILTIEEYKLLNSI